MTATKRSGGFLRPMLPRDGAEPHRVATPLELLFDLISVIAIAAAAAGLHHAIAEDHLVQGVITFVMAFFAIWWAWMNYTWFASSYDNDDALFRLLTMVIMGGSLTIAAGVDSLFKSFDMTMVVVGYVVMRVGMVALWLRAAYHNNFQGAPLAYAVGIVLAQLFWIVFLFLQPLAPAVTYSLFATGVVLELAVPLIAERKGATAWHRHHIIERYGLLNIIVLGETLLAATVALRNVAVGATDPAYIYIALSALVILFAMWWLYFSEEDHLESNDLRRAFAWAYGHFVIFASGAAVGAGLAVMIDQVAQHSKVQPIVGTYAVAVPVALYMLGLWFVRDRFLNDAVKYVLPIFAALVLLAPMTPLGVIAIAAVTAVSVIVRNHLARSSAP